MKRMKNETLMVNEGYISDEMKNQREVIHCLLTSTIALQELLENILPQSNHFNSSYFRLPFIKVTRIASSYLWQFPSDDTYCIKIFIQIQDCVNFFTKTLTNYYIHQENNYFGDRYEHVLIQECNLMITWCSDITDKLSSSMDPRLSTSSLCNFLFSVSDQSQVNHEMQTAFINGKCLLGKLFWFKYFQWKPTIVWSEFQRAFNVEYGNQRDHALEEFKRLLLFGSVDELLQHEIISYIQMDAFCDGYESIFAAYQDKCNPHTSIVICGCLVDNLVSYPTPTVLKSLLGMRVSYVSCGDQHIAVVSSSGLVYTMGKGNFGRLGHGNEEDLAAPTLVLALSGKKCRQVSCGFAFTTFVTEDGALYTCGAGMNGRLGLGNDANRLFPMFVSTLAEEFVLSKLT